MATAEPTIPSTTEGVTTAEKIRLLPWNIGHNAANAVFGQLTFFGSAFVLFLSALGASNSQIGFLFSLLPFTGIVAVFIAPRVARFGYKRTFITFWGIRKVVGACLLLVPWVLSQFGSEAALAFVSLIVFGFALCRSIGETGYYPWNQEFIPVTIRGKHAAVNDMVSRVTGTIAIIVAGYIVGLGTGLDRFMLLFGVAVIFGVIAVWSSTHLPGGEPTTASSTTSYRAMLQVLRDRNFVRYIFGLSLAIFGAAPLAFIPLFMHDPIGLTESQIIWLQVGTILGGFTATYLLGWAADRYGSKPVMLSGLYLRLLLPLGFLVMPRQSSLSLIAALGISVVWGIGEIAWAIGSTRLLFVKVVPSEKKAEYMAVFYALIGIMGGVSQIISGQLLDATANLSGTFLFFTLDPYTPLFFGSLILTVIGIMILRTVQADSSVSVSEFAGMFIHGNPFMALESLVGYYRARTERATVVMTERMGQTRSPLTVDELLEALKDPRFNVRFEAIISIARSGREPRLIEALTKFLDGTEISLSVIAAWALGRMGDESALPSLREGLYSQYKSLQAHCVRSLGTLGDVESAPLVLERLQTETDKGLRIAYSSALGNLHYTPALDTLFEVLNTTENEGARMELALAIARIGGSEPHFIRLLRQLRSDPPTSAAQVVMAAKRKLDRSGHETLKTAVDGCASQFASGHMDEGARMLCQIIGQIPHGDNGAEIEEGVREKIYIHCCDILTASGASRIEYLVLALHTL